MKFYRGNKGFTLIEIVAAMVILAIVAVPLGKTFIDSFKYQARSQIKTEANKVIEYVAEQLKNGEYKKLEAGLETEIKEWIDKSSALKNIEFDVMTLPDEYGNLTDSYKVTLEASGYPTEVQKGGVGTPVVYDLTMQIIESGINFTDNGYYLNATYTGNLLDIESVNEANAKSGGYSILIKNESSSPVTIDVRKEIVDKVTIYTSGADINLRTYPDPTLSKEEKNFQRIKLGDKDKIEDKKEYFYTARVTAVNSEDSTITSTMNITFNVKI